jgi:FixJ family two-component response regulator
MTPEPTVFIVDDDEAVRGALNWLISSVDLKTADYPSAQAFLDAYDVGLPGCLLLDVRMAGMSGLELQDVLTERRIDLPVIIITGHGDVQMAVNAMKRGAFDFIEKPFNNQVLLERVQRAVERSVRAERQRAKQAKVMQQWKKLTLRERQVLDMVVAGETNKVIAGRLGISEKTVEVHRSKVIEKMKAKSLADLMKKAPLQRP